VPWRLALLSVAAHPKSGPFQGMASCFANGYSNAFFDAGCDVHRKLAKKMQKLKTLSRRFQLELCMAQPFAQSAAMNSDFSNHLLKLVTSFDIRNYFTPGTFLSDTHSRNK
jgi:hypothetical protein